MSDGKTVRPTRAAASSTNRKSPKAVAAAPATVENVSEIISRKEFVMADVVNFEKIIPGMDKAATETVAQMKAGYEEFQGKFQSMMEKNMKSMADVTEFTKGNFEAVVESAKAATSGAEVLANHFVETSKTAVEEAQAAFKSMSAAKTPNELFQHHNDFAKAQFDRAVSNWSKVSETWMKVAGEVVQPLSNRMAVAAESVKKAVA